MDLDVLLPDIKRKIGDFERDFLQKEGRKPTKSDIEAVPSVLRYYKFYEKSRRHQASLTGSGSTDTDVQSPKPQPPILTPSKVWSNKLNKTNNSSTTESGPNSPLHNSTLSAITVKLRKLTREHMEQELVSTSDKRVNYSLAAKRAHLNEKRILQQNKKKMEKEEEVSRKMEEEKVSREKELEEEDSSIEIIEDSGYVEQHESAISTPSTSLSCIKSTISTPNVYNSMVSTIPTQSGTDHAHTLSNLSISTPSTSLSGTKFAALYSRYASMDATISTSFGSNLLATSTPVTASKLPTRIFLSDLVANSPRLNPTAIFTTIDPTLASISTPPALTTRPSVESASSTSSTSSSVLFDDEPFELDSTNEAIKQSIIPIIIEGDDGQPIRETLREHTPKASVPPPVFGLDDDGAYSGSFRKWRKHEEKYGQTKVKERKFFKNLFTESALEEEEVSRKKMKEDKVEEVSRKNVFDFVVDDPIDVKVVVEPPEVEFLPRTSKVEPKVTATKVTKPKGNKKATTSAPKVNYRRLQMKKKCFAKGKGKFNMKRYRFKQWKADTWTAKKRQQIKSYQDEIVSTQQRMIQEQDVPEEVATGGSSLVRMIRSSGALFDDQKDSELNELLSDASMAFGLDLDLVHEDVLLVTKRILTGESSLLVNTCSIAQRHFAYQLPTYCYWSMRKSIAIVITPLRSLNADHWANFPEKCVLKPVCINSEQSDSERKRSVKSLISGQAQLLFLSLEYVAIGTILSILTQDGFPEVSLIYLDQAEGLVEWSSDFRPGLFHLLNILHLQFGVKNILAGVDSFVTRESRLKICRNLGLDPMLDVIGPEFELSPKLKLGVTKTNDKLNVLAGLLRAHPYSTLPTVMILANRKETCDQLETQLRSLLQVDLINQKGKSNRIVAFHEGTVPYQRAQIKKDFRRKKIRFLISTFAFGLGLTKPASRDGSLRAVICYSMPESFELFAQVLSRVNIPGSEDDKDSSVHASLSYAHVLIDKSGQELIQLLNDKCYRNGMDRWSVKRLVELVYAPCKCKWFAAQEVDDEPMEVDSDTELDLEFLKNDYEVKPENGVDPTQSEPQVCSDIGANISSQTGSDHAQTVSNATISTPSVSIDATISTEDVKSGFVDEVNLKVAQCDDPQADVDSKLVTKDCEILDGATISTPCVPNPIGAAISTQDEIKSRSSSETIDLDDDELEWIDDEEEGDSDVEVKIVERVKWVKPVIDPLLTTMIELVDVSGSTPEVVEEVKEPVICPRHLVAFPLTSTELELDIRSEVIYSLLAALELGGGLPIAHASIRLEAPTLSVCTVVNFGDEEQFEQIVQRSAALRLGMDLRRRECEKNSYIFTPNNFRFSVVEVARLMGKEVREVKSELGKLEWIQANARNSSKSSRKSCINVRFSEFSYVVSASGSLSPEELDSVTDYLDGALKRAEQMEVWKLQQLYSRFAQSADAPGSIGSNMLKEFLNYYFQEDSRLDRLSPEVYQRALPCSFKLDNHDLDSINGTLCQLIDLYYEENGVNSPRKVARILQGIESPKFPAKIWRGVKHFWGTLPGMHFAQLMELARESLQERYQHGRKFC